jgi:ATP-dependent protease ClpP protease subunit
MPTWGGILQECQTEFQQGNAAAHDTIRRRYLLALNEHTKRNTILYASRFTQKGGVEVPADLVDEDMQGLMETVHGLRGKSLDLILHSPGGSLDAAESIVIYLRERFSDVRVIVPHLAQSAATMIACSANLIVMGEHSFLGPTDPQLLIRTALGTQFVPAQDITRQFDEAVVACQDPQKLAAYAPMLGQYGPHLLVMCENVTRLSQELVGTWLYRYMFRRKKAMRERADKISAWLSKHEEFRSHSRHIPRGALKAKGLLISDLESDATFQDLVLSVFHAVSMSFQQGAVAKIIENHQGKAFIKLHGSIQLPMQIQQMQPASGQPLHFQIPIRPPIQIPPGPPQQPPQA